MCLAANARARIPLAPFGIADFDSPAFCRRPFVVSLHHGLLVMNVTSVAVLVAGSYALSERKHLFAIAIVLSAVTIVGTGLLVAFP